MNARAKVLDLVELDCLAELLQPLPLFFFRFKLRVGAERILNEAGEACVLEEFRLNLTLEQLHRVKNRLASLFVVVLFLVEAAEHKISAVGSEFQNKRKVLLVLT